MKNNAAKSPAPPKKNDEKLKVKGNFLDVIKAAGKNAKNKTKKKP